MTTRAPSPDPPLPPPARERVVILGGGPAALATAWALTREPDWQRRRQVTVVQLGWRLGGKCATGRNPRRGQRVEEHGLHMLFGFYHNTHRMLQEAFAELARGPECPIRSWDDAFAPYDTYTMQHPFGGAWRSWSIEMPRSPFRPGGPRSPAALWLAGAWIARSVRHLAALLRQRRGDPAIRRVAALARPALRALLRAPLALGGGDLQARAARALQDGLDRVEAALGDAVERDLDLYRAWITLDACGTILAGVLADRLLERGLEAIDGERWDAWLVRHGLSRITRDSCVVQTAFDSSFAVSGREYDMEAGVVLQLVARDGVIDEVRMTEQVRLAVPAYEPLITVKGLPCWPSEPDWRQLDPEQAAAIRRAGVDLERCGQTPPGAREQALRRGVDFDVVVCAIPVGGLARLTPTLARQSPRWAAMLAALKTTRTQAMQLWFDRPLQELGWPDDSSVLSCFGREMNTWSDLSMTLEHEGWEGQAPRAVGYFCGPLTAGPEAHPGAGDDDARHAAEQRLLARAESLRFIADKLPHLLPAAFRREGGRRELDWERLVAPAGARGEARFDAQYVRANSDPWERYVLSVTGSSRHRLRPDDTGFRNLLIAGDWVKNGLDAGCVEAAVTSGLLAARALCGSEAPIANARRLGGAPSPAPRRAGDDERRTAADDGARGGARLSHPAA